VSWQFKNRWFDGRSQSASLMGLQRRRHSGEVPRRRDIDVARTRLWQKLHFAHADRFSMHNAGEIFSKLDCAPRIFLWIYSFLAEDGSGICPAKTFPMRNLSSSSSGQVRKLSNAEIASVAYQLFLDQGSRHGHDLEDWLRAEQMLLCELSNQTAEQQLLTPAKSEVESPIGLRPFDTREYPFARDIRGIPDREDIRRKTTPFRPASRQTRSGRPNERRKVEA
jgi:Protein of unknown function (DUF2934)